jgi:signal transduction histidine kinase
MNPAQKPFAHLERAGADQLDLETRAAKQSPLIKGVLEAVEDPLLVLNSHRQVLLANAQAIETLGQEIDAEAVGKRPGEMFECVHSNEGPGGCGGSEACLDCGALQAVLSARRNKRPETREFLLTLRRKTATEAAEYRVRAAPFQVGPHEFITVHFQDISAQKRREALERIFFHDVMNTIGGLRGWSETLVMMKDSNPESAEQRIVALSDLLVREILDQKVLLEAERGDLVPAFCNCRIGEVYEVVRDVLSENSVAKERTLEIASEEDSQTIVSDPGLLRRVLVNLVVNAFEATAVGGVVRVWHTRRGGRVIFHVWNADAMAANVARRVFQRSFSTKAKKGRGIGTYSARLLVERYLGGQVTFRSTSEEGTTFLVELPERPKAAATS